MIKYIIGFFRHLFYKNVSSFSLVDHQSSISKKSRIARNVKVFHSRIGEYSYVGRRSSLIHASVGKYCSISGNVVIGLGNHTLDRLSTSPIFTERHNGTGYSWIDADVNGIKKYKPVEIGNDVWIGARVVIVGGVKVGDGAVIGAGAVVTKDIPAFAIAAGVPARIIRYRFPENTIAKLKEISWWNYPEDVLQQNIDLFQKQNITEQDIERIAHEITCNKASR